jgi:hypothetical protein
MSFFGGQQEPPAVDPLFAGEDRLCIDDYVGGMWDPNDYFV